MKWAVVPFVESSVLLFLPSADTVYNCVPLLASQLRETTCVLQFT